MICQHCAAGADLLTTRGNGTHGAFAKLAAALHDRCRGCDCQHGRPHTTTPDQPHTPPRVTSHP